MTKTATLSAVLLILALGACTQRNDVQQTEKAASAAPAVPVSSPSPSRDPLAARDPGPTGTVEQSIPDTEARPVMQAQVVLDRLGFTPGVVDGKSGLSTRNAVAGFQEANGLTVTGEIDDPTRQALAQWSAILATRVVTIPADFAAGPFYRVPKGPAEQAKLPALGYESLDEKLAERFHTTVATLKLLNPGGMPAGMARSIGPSASPMPGETASAQATASASAGAGPLPGAPSYFHEGQQVRVPNVGGDAIDVAAVADTDWLRTLTALGVGTSQPAAKRIVVSRSKGTLKAYDAAGKLVAVYTATMGSTHDPLPLGQWKVNGVSRNPKFHYNPALFWDARADGDKATLPPGPNGPVGIVWIDINKPHYGIHGTPNPEAIGRAESHGCVRLTNWDAARLAQMVSPGMQVLFEL